MKQTSGSSLKSQRHSHLDTVLIKNNNGNGAITAKPSFYGVHGRGHMLFIFQLADDLIHSFIL